MSKSKTKMVDISLRNLISVVCSQKTVTFSYKDDLIIVLTFKFNKDALDFYISNYFFTKGEEDISGVEVIGFEIKNSNKSENENPD